MHLNFKVEMAAGALYDFYDLRFQSSVGDESGSGPPYVQEQERLFLLCLSRHMYRASDYMFYGFIRRVSW